jgi:hypothetical protein
VRDVSLSLGEQRAFAQAGLTPKRAALFARARPLPVQSIQPGKTARTTFEATGLLGVILIFIVLTQYLTWTLMGTMEKSEPAHADHAEAEQQRPGADRDEAARQPARRQPKSTTHRGRHPRKG